MKPTIPNTLYLLYQEILLWNHKTKWTKLLILPKASKWEMMIFVKRICIPEWGISLTHQFNCLESFEGQKWSTERNYPSLNEVGPVSASFCCPEKAKNTCKSNWNNEQI